uniref:Uncharacterized protein n=1 Tax=Oryza nivara TaxID=4536 RepID=A0A0E0I0K0_ORYNI
MKVMESDLCHCVLCGLFQEMTLETVSYLCENPGKILSSKMDRKYQEMKPQTKLLMCGILLLFVRIPGMDQEIPEYFYISSSESIISMNPDQIEVAYLAMINPYVTDDTDR